MGTKTLLRRLLGKIKPSSETEFREIQLAGHKLRGVPGDDSWAKAERQHVDAIREGKQPGDSTVFKVPWCIKCSDKGIRVLLLEDDGRSWCGRCKWERPKRKEMI